MRERGDNIIKSLMALTGRKSFVVGPRLTARKGANLRTPNLLLKAGRPERTATIESKYGARDRRK